MYDRAPRALTLTVGGTASHLGPGCYELPPDTKRLQVGYAPFLSFASRGHGSIYRNAESDVPGPGSYEIEKTQKTVKGGKSPQNKEKRFREIRADTPGPGTYCQPPSMGLDTNRIKKPSKISAAQKLAECIKVFRKSEAPSIPSQGQSFGYEEAADGTLLKHNPPSRDTTLGPAYYQTKGDCIYPTMKYKGVQFGNLTEKRPEFKPREGPGPADYDVIPENAVHYENVNIRKEDQRKYDLYVPRYHEVIVLQEEKKGVPGPGQYYIRSQFEKPVSATRSAPFLSLAQRFAPVKSTAPAPGTYNETRYALESLKKATQTKNIPFGNTAVRFTQDHRLRKSPGPAFYNILNHSIATESLKKADMEKKKKGAFGSSVPRLLYLVKREAFTTPGPADYQVKETTEEPRKKKKELAIFASVTERIPRVSSEAPPPGSYDVQKSFEKSQCKSEYMAPRTATAKRKHTSFLSGSIRHGICEAKKDMPGPGAYSPETSSLRLKSPSYVAVYVSQVERFKEAKDDTPGPGTYELSPLLKDTVLKRTFNATLNNPVVIQVGNSIYRPMTEKDIFCVSNELVSKKQNETTVAGSL
uniref:Sperm tail PG-rich repeat containing 2 n=1 Tax=Podarcis muralis TaxID=64176 RepID=A0A670IYW3_PODMU|nr:sperm-tail PG-rich repeat-containing protein 2 [Podarcis muralis]